MEAPCVCRPVASTTQLAVQALLARRDRLPDQYVELGYHCVTQSGDVVLKVGGVYDRLNHEYVRDREHRTSVAVELNANQVDAALAFAWFLERFVAYRRARLAGHNHHSAYASAFADNATPLYNLHFYGGRRGGKSFLAVVLIAMFAIAVPGSRCILASPTQRRTLELQLAFESVVPSSWRRWQGVDQCYTLATGSRVECHTTGKAELKIGACDLVLVNEAQECLSQAVMDLDGNTVDQGGMLIFAYNPPRSHKGIWIRDKYRAAKSGQDLHTELFFFDPEKNHHINLDALRAKASSWGRLRYRREFQGDMDAPFDDTVFPEFTTIDHIRDWIPRTWRDITRDRTQRYYGHRAEYVGAIDFDKRAGISWVWAKFFETLSGDEIVYVLGGERKVLAREDLLDRELLAMKDQDGAAMLGGHRSRIVWVCDASAKKYSTESRDPDDPTSWEKLTRHGWRLVTPVDGYDNNPPPQTRYDLARDKLDARAVVFDGAATELIKCVSEWPIDKRTGDPIERDKRSHLNDCWTYLLFRRFYERNETARNGATRVERFQRRRLTDS